MFWLMAAPQPRQLLERRRYLISSLWDRFFLKCHSITDRATSNVNQNKKIPKNRKHQNVLDFISNFGFAAWQTQAILERFLVTFLLKSRDDPGVEKWSSTIWNSKESKYKVIINSTLKKTDKEGISENEVQDKANEKN